MEKHRINNITAAMYYIPNFLTEKEEQAILSKIPANRWTTLSHRRLQAVPTQLTANNTLLASPLPDWLMKPVVERIQALGFFEGAPHGVNHCLINEYLPGQGIMPHEDGGAYHPVVATVSLGGTLVLDVSSKSTSALSPTEKVEVEALNQRSTEMMAGGMIPREETGPWRIVQEPRSLLITRGSAYADTLHGISETKEDLDLNAESTANWDLLGDRDFIEAANGRSVRAKRISLTFRDVKRVSNLSSKLLGNRRS